MTKNDWLVVGISGATCSGKSTIAKTLHSLFRNSVIIHQDDYFYDPSSEKHTKIPELKHINFEILSSVDMKAMKDRIQEVVSEAVDDEKELLERRTDLGERFRERCKANEAMPANVCLMEKIRNLKRVPNILFLDGFLVFNDEELINFCDLRFYFTIGKEVCWQRRKVRTYDPPDVPGYFDNYVWPIYLLHYEEVLLSKLEIKYIDGADTIENNFRTVFHKLLTFLS